MEDLNLLRQVPFFADLHDQDLQVLAEVAHEEHFPRDSVIIEEGQINKSLYFLVEGQVKVYLEKISGRTLTLAVLKQGSLFGDDCLAEDERPSPKVAALQDSTVIRFDKNDFLRGISNDALILANMLKETSSRRSYKIGPVDDMSGEGDEESQLHKEFPIFEKRFAIELEGIKLISKKIEDISNDTSAYIKDKSEETISWVEQRSKEAIESSERRSREVTEHAEKQAAQAIELAEKTIAKALEEAKSRTEAEISQVEKAISSTRAETEASLKKVEIFWNNIKKGVVLLSSVLAILGSILVYFGYPEFKHVMETREKIKENQEFIERIKKNMEVDSADFKEKMSTFKNQLIELSALKAMVLTIGRIRMESQLNRDEIDRYKSAHIAYQENRKNLIPYFSSYNKEYRKPVVIVESLNNFLKLIYYADDKISEEEKNDILATCLSSLANVKEQDFRYRLTVRENLILFGKILNKSKSEFFNDLFHPSLIGVLREQEFDNEAKFTVAQALAALEQGNDECVNILMKEMEKTDKKRMWRRASAAVSLVYLKNQKGHDYLFDEMKPYREHRLIAALSLGEAVAKSDVIRLDKDERRKLLNCLEEGVNRTHNLFQKDYAMAVLNTLKEKEEFKSLN